MNLQKEIYTIKLCLEAAKDGFPEAQYGMSVLYANGEGVPTDLVEAYAWAKIASINGEKDANEIIAQIPRYLTSIQFRKAQDLAEKYIQLYK